MVIFERNIYIKARNIKTEMLSFLLKSETQSAIVR